MSANTYQLNRRTRPAKSRNGVAKAPGTVSTGDSSSFALSILNQKLDKAVFDELFEKVTDDNGTISIRAKYSLWSDGSMASKGMPGEGSGGSAAFGLLQEWEQYDASVAQQTALSAYLGKDLLDRITTLEQSGTGFDEAQLAQYLSTNNYATHSWVEGKGYALSSSLGNYLPLTGGTLSDYLTINTVGKTDTPLRLNSNSDGCYLQMSANGTSLGHYGAVASGPVWNKNGVNRTIWHSGNDGSGSGLDADLLDGQHLSDILASNVASASKLQTTRTIWGQNFNGENNVNGRFELNGVASGTLSIFDGTDYRAIQTYQVKPLCLNPVGNNVAIGKTTADYKLDVNGAIHTNNHIAFAYGAISGGSENYIQVLKGSAAHGIAVGGLLVSSSYADYSKVPTNGAYIKGNVVIDGTLTVKGFKLDVVDGKLVLNGSAYATGSFASKGGVSGGSGSGGSGGGYERLDAWNDYTLAKAGYVLSAALGYELHTRLTTLEGKNFLTAHQELLKIVSKDLRSTNITPGYDEASLRAFFQLNTTDELTDGGNYNGVLWFKPYGSTTDFSGGYPHELGFTINGNIWHRIATGSSTWGAWKKLLDSDNTKISSGVITINGTSITPLTSHQSLANYVDKTSAQEISGVKTFKGASLKIIGSTYSTSANRNTAGVLAFQENSYDDQFGIWANFYGATTNQNLYIGGSGDGSSLANTADGSNFTPYLTIQHTTGNLTVLGKIIKSGGTSSQFLKADGSVDSTAYLAASSYTAADVLSKIKGVDGAGSGLDADLLDGYHEGSFLRYRAVTSVNGENTLWSQIGIKQYNGALPDGLSGTYNYGAVISLPALQVRCEFYCSHTSSESSGLWFRSGWDDDKKKWKRLACITDNVASASKLQTTRAIWGQNFNGEGNVSGDMTGVGNITMSGAIFFAYGAISGGSENHIRVSKGNAAHGIAVGGLLVSSSYADYSKVPTNGAYIKGNVVIDGTLTVKGFKIDVVDGKLVLNGSAYATGSFSSKSGN